MGFKDSASLPNGAVLPNVVFHSDSMALVNLSLYMIIQVCLFVSADYKGHCQ